MAEMARSPPRDEDFRNFKQLYDGIMKGDKAKVMAKYADIRRDPSDITTVSKDTLLHIAIYMKQESIAKEILKKCDQSTLGTPNALGDTVLHEAAATNMTCLAKNLLILAPDLLDKENAHGETALFRAAHYGCPEMFELLADLTAKKETSWNSQEPNYSIKRNDGTTILHMTILAEFFDLALEIVNRYPDLVNVKDGRGMIGLQLLSSNPSAFKSGTNYGLLKKFIYYCAPSKDTKTKEDSHRGDAYVFYKQEAPELPPTCYSKAVRMLTSELRKINVSIWRFLCQGWPMMKRICEEKRKNESAFELAKLLIKEDLSWDKISPKESNNVSLRLEQGKGKDSGRQGKLTEGTSSSPNIGVTEADKGLGLPRTETSKGTSSSPNIGVTEADKGLGLPRTETSKGTSSSPNIGVTEADRNVDLPWTETSKGTSSSPNTQVTEEGGSVDSTTREGEVNEGSTSKETTTALLLATSTGIKEIVDEILRMYPQAVEYVSDDYNQNILHVAIMHRRLEIFDHVKDLTIPMFRLVRRIDKSGYTLLHQVGEMEHYTGSTHPGPALQLQEELRWFERVQEIIPSHYKMHRSNIKGQTAQEFFEASHEKLLEEAKEWLKRTSESCSAVAVLIATVAFAAAYTVPGGSNKRGTPILLHDPFFLVFTVMDVLSLASSLTSVVMFLSILTSPFQLQDFRRSLPLKLILGFTFLFFSVAVTMLAFAATIMLIIHLKKRWTTMLMYTASFLPVTVFALLQFPLFDAVRIIWKSSSKVIKSIVPQYLLPRRLKTTKPFSFKTQ